MLFNSTEFLVFLPLVFLLYWFVFKGSLKAQNCLLLVASYVFYGWWDWRFLFLIFASTSIDFILGYFIYRASGQGVKKLFLALSLTANLGLLGFFKYYNFFIESFQQAFGGLGFTFSSYTLQVILPVGISFYTFQTMSYTIDVYRQKLKPTANIVAFFTFVSFFPQLVAGPIERAGNLLPQFMSRRSFSASAATDGLRLILWGLFKKVVIADTCARYADLIFSNYETLPAGLLWLGAFLFAFQIYGDFSGYSDIAIGTARLFGIELMQNFYYPYFSSSIAAFWRRWHISLSSWFRDYVYIPLGGSRGSSTARSFNIMAVFFLSGLWHGANWTFIGWGLFHGLLYLFSTGFTTKNQTGATEKGKNSPPAVKKTGMVVLTFTLVSVGWVFFRSASLHDAFMYLSGMVSAPNGTGIDFLRHHQLGLKYLFILFMLIAVLLTAEWLQRRELHPLRFTNKNIPALFRWAAYYLLTLLILYFYSGEKTFIYFQF